MKSVNIQFGTAAQFAGVRGQRNGLIFVGNTAGPTFGSLNLINSAGAVFHLEVGAVRALFVAGE